MKGDKIDCRILEKNLENIESRGANLSIQWKFTYIESHWNNALIYLKVIIRFCCAKFNNNTIWQIFDT